MTEAEYRAAMDNGIYLAACAVNGTVPDSARVAGMDLGLLYMLMKRHSMASVVAFALEAAGVKEPVFVQARAAAIRRLVLFDAERAALFNRLDEAGIWHVPLKGAVLAKLYPQYGMREMADNDILVDAQRFAEIGPIMESCGFHLDHDSFVHASYFKAPVCNFEMHRVLFDPGRKSWNAYYQDLEKRLLPDGDGSCARHFSDEDFYIYITAHEYKHYTGGGTGLRSLLDVYVYCRKKGATLDWTYIEKELKTLGLADFERDNRGLALHLFGGDPLQEGEQAMLDYILSSGTYGTTSNSVNNSVVKNGGSKLRYMLGRFFVPVRPSDAGYASFSRAYPLFYRHRILLPLLPFYRVFRSMRRGNFVREARALKNAGAQKKPHIQ